MNLEAMKDRTARLLKIKDELAALEVEVDGLEDVMPARETYDAKRHAKHPGPLTIRCGSDDIVIVDGGGFYEEFYFNDRRPTDSPGFNPCCRLWLSNGLVIQAEFSSKVGWILSVIEGDNDRVDIGTDPKSDPEEPDPMATIHDPVEWIVRLCPAGDVK